MLFNTRFRCQMKVTVLIKTFSPLLRPQIRRSEVASFERGGAFSHNLKKRINLSVVCIGHYHTITSKLQSRPLSSKMACANSNSGVRIACVQLCCNEDKQQNFETARSLILQAKERNAKMIFLPEAFDFVGRSKEESVQLSETLEGPLITSYKGLAKELDVWLSLGGFHERQEETRDGTLPWMTNNHILIDNNGDMISVYRKIHLFDVVIPEENVNLQESSFIKPGNEIVKPVETPVGKIGLGICYDLRFPRFSLSLRSLGANILTYPSAFTIPTGKAHWETLLRARAIETQCFVVAAAQTGQHNHKRASYGHSLIVDPWGKVIADAGEEVGIIIADIDLKMVETTNKKMPVVNHSRPELYSDSKPKLYRIPSQEMNEESFTFGRVRVKYSCTFLESNHARSFVNKKCVVPGHVLVSTKRIAKRMQELSAEEISDLFCLVQKVQRIVESIYGATSSSVVVQDGKEAGQTIEHVHVHILPRKENDFKQNDEIYDRLAEHDKGEDIKWRDEKEMIEECSLIRQHIKDNFADFLS